MANLILYYSANVILKNCEFLELWEEVVEVRDQMLVSQVHEKTQGAFVRALSRGNWVVVMVNRMIPMVVLVQHC
jgi:F0F1-type ATP synthase membrane subunit a